MRKRVIFMCAVIILANILAGCFGEKYSVDYDGRKDDFSGAKNSYRAGSKVKIYFKDVGTDTDYAFYLDGNRIDAFYSRNQGYEISFTMPDHDVKLTYAAFSSMMTGGLQEFYTVTANLFMGNEGQYRPGDTVRLLMPLATDTNYTFYIDGEKVQADYEDWTAVIEFIMPEHDVLVEYSSYNTMTAD